MGIRDMVLLLFTRAAWSDRCCTRGIDISPWSRGHLEPNRLSFHTSSPGWWRRWGHLSWSRISHLWICHQLRWRKGVPLPLRENVGFRFHTDDLVDAVSERTRLLIHSQNPTGGFWEKMTWKWSRIWQINTTFMSSRRYSRILWRETWKHNSIA